MAGKLFADRAFVTINGFEAVHLKKADLTVNENLTRVDTMTRNRRTAGYKRGNKHIQLSLELDIEQLRAQIDIALAKDGAEVNCVFECGGERYTATGLAQTTMKMSGSVGDSSKSLELEALDIVNENGSSVNVDIALG